MTTSCKSLASDEIAALLEDDRFLEELGFGKRTERSLGISEGYLQDFRGFRVVNHRRSVAEVLYFDLAHVLLASKFGLVFSLPTSEIDFEKSFYRSARYLAETARLNDWTFARFVTATKAERRFLLFPTRSQLWLEIAKRPTQAEVFPIPGTIIRRPHSNDEPRLRKMISKSIYFGFNEFERAVYQTSHTEVEALSFSLRGSIPFILVADRQGDLVGVLFADLGWNPKGSIRSARLFDVFIETEYEGQGIATAMTNVFERFCSQQGFELIEGTVKGETDEHTFKILNGLEKQGWMQVSTVVDFDPYYCGGDWQRVSL